MFGFADDGPVVTEGVAVKFFEGLYDVRPHGMKSMTTEIVPAALKKNMNVVIHEDPGIDGTFFLYSVPSEALKKTRLVLIVVEYVSLVDSPHHNMVQGSGHIESRLTWHEVILLNRVWIVKPMVSCGFVMTSGRCI
jgi:hypothetical protein